MSEESPRPPAWVLQESVRVTCIETGKDSDVLLVERLHRPGAVVISLVNDRMLFNGQYIETEEFTSYLGIFDQVAEELGVKAQIGASILIDEDNRETNTGLMVWAVEASVEARRELGRGTSPADVANVLIDLAFAIKTGDVAEATSPIQNPDSI